MTEPTREALVEAQDMLPDDWFESHAVADAAHRRVSHYIDATNAKLAERDAEIAQWQNLHRDNCAAYDKAAAEREHFRNMVPTADMIPRAQVEAAIAKVEKVLKLRAHLYGGEPLNANETAIVAGISKVVLAALADLKPAPKVTLLERAWALMANTKTENGGTIWGAREFQAALDKLGLELVVKGDAE